MKIYTKAGDGGETGLFGGQKVGKDHARVGAYGEVDELNAAIGAARSLIPDRELAGELGRIQDQLFAVGAELATPREAKARSILPAIDPAWIASMEAAIDRWDGELPALQSFILPGGTPAGAALHLARCVCRRAERAVVALARETTLDPNVVIHLNRLSDYLFVAARLVNHRAKTPETPWVPARPRT
jgi:cob(I)alamin adenosyltransferase